MYDDISVSLCLWTSSGHSGELHSECVGRASRGQPPRCASVVLGTNEGDIRCRHDRIAIAFAALSVWALSCACRSLPCMCGRGVRGKPKDTAMRWLALQCWHMPGNMSVFVCGAWCMYSCLPQLPQGCSPHELFMVSAEASGSRRLVGVVLGPTFRVLGGRLPHSVEGRWGQSDLVAGMLVCGVHAIGPMGRPPP